MGTSARQRSAGYPRTRARGLLCPSKPDSVDGNRHGDSTHDIMTGVKLLLVSMTKPLLF